MTKANNNGSRRKATIILIAVALGAGAAGAAGMRAYMIGDMRALMDGKPGHSRAKMRLRAMKRHLDLTDEQATKIEAIFAEYGDARGEAIAPCKPKMDALREQIGARIDEVLNEEQRAKHAKFRERLQKRRDER